MFELLCYHLGGGKDHDFINQEHVAVSNIIKHQSEFDFHQGSIGNGLIDRIECKSLEQKGNLF
jgi:hypothetical protein